MITILCAADTFKAIEKLYGVEDVPLFRETYPFDNHLKVSIFLIKNRPSNRNFIPICGLFGSLSAVTALLEVKTEVRFPKSAD